jgi:Xaa-Pro aminopeptidase
MIGVAPDIAVKVVRPGITSADIASVWPTCEAWGLKTEAEARGMATGHGIGLEVHELPVLGPGGGELAAGNVITLEPGLYYPGKGGIRLEDMGVVTMNGFRDLTTMPREFRV